jgi:hypothetical protein
MSRISRRTVAIAAAAVALPAVVVGLSAAASGVEVDTPITGGALAQASDAALAEMGGGTVTGTEVGDEDSYYEVEVTLDDGSQVDVQLDESFALVKNMPDHEAR